MASCEADTTLTTQVKKSFLFHEQELFISWILYGRRKGYTSHGTSNPVGKLQYAAKVRADAARDTPTRML